MGKVTVVVGLHVSEDPVFEQVLEDWGPEQGYKILMKRVELGEKEGRMGGSFTKERSGRKRRGRWGREPNKRH